MEPDTLKLWALANEFTEKLNANRSLIQNLRRHAEELKTSAKEIGGAYKVRRYNIDLSKEVFESELERNNAALVMENHALIYENRQLDALLKEYEQSLQTVMAKVRHHSQITLQHEGALQAHYEALLAAQDAQHNPPCDSPAEENFSHSVTRLKHLLKLAIHTEQQPLPEDDDAASISPLGSTSLEEALIKLGINPDLPDSPTSPGRDTVEEICHDWMHEREVEISRLTEENALIRQALGIAPGGVGYTDHERAEYGQGRSIYGEENAGTLKRQMHAKRDSIISSPGQNFGNGLVSPRGTYREPSPPEPLQLQPPVSQNQSNNNNGGTMRGGGPAPGRDIVRRPPPMRGLSSIRPSSPIGLYRNISLPSTGVGGDTARK